MEKFDLKHSEDATRIYATEEEKLAIEQSLQAIDRFGTISNREALDRLRAKFPNLSFR